MEVVDRRLLELAPDSLPSEPDLTDPDQQRAVRALAEAMEAAAEAGGAAALQEADRRIGARDDVPVLAQVALKLAASRACFREVSEPIHVSVVFAVYKEHLRILPVSEHPAGEDLVREKLTQLRWLFGATPQHSWDLTVVDDGCPEGSGELIQEILDEFAEADEEIRVLFLNDAIEAQESIVAGLDSTDDSRKGGSIRLGLWHAARKERPATHHVALFTDADLSTHLGQIGLLASPFAGDTSLAVLGSRREDSSVVVKSGMRNERGKLFVYLWKRLLSPLTGIIDTQCGFKAFDARKLGPVLEGMQDSGFSFDLELLLRCRLADDGALTKAPIAWIDSEEASTTTDLDPYLAMLQSIVGLYRRHLPVTESADGFADLIDELEPSTFYGIVDRLPSELADREPREFEDYGGVTAKQLGRLVGLA